MLTSTGDIVQQLKEYCEDQSHLPWTRGARGGLSHYSRSHQGGSPLRPPQHMVEVVGLCGLCSITVGRQDCLTSVMVKRIQMGKGDPREDPGHAGLGTPWNPPRRAGRVQGHCCLVTWRRWEGMFMALRQPRTTNPITPVPNSSQQFPTVPSSTSKSLHPHIVPVVQKPSNME